MNIINLRLGSYQTNTYILYADGGKSCLVIDPGYEPETILDKVQELGLTLEAILLTHGHFDHVGGVRQLAADTDCRVYINDRECSMPGMLTAGPLYYTHTYDDGDRLTLAGLDFTVMATPGHTPGAVCLAFDAHLFTGDTLFAGSCGRTDLPGGDWKAIQASLKRLSGLETDPQVYPGHGPATTLSWEKNTNPYMH